MTAYPTFERADQRVAALRRTGVWPGIRTLRDGTYALTYDPGDPPRED